MKSYRQLTDKEYALIEHDIVNEYLPGRTRMIDIAKKYDVTISSALRVGSDIINKQIKKDVSSKK